jgi:glycerophosphoryl diester phosphodiesterase
MNKNLITALGFCVTFAGFAFPAAAQNERTSAPKVSAPIKSPWNVRNHVPLKNFIIQSHRGAGELAEENTIEAFELGWKLGTYPEADIRMTRDGVIVAFHDDNFERVVKGISPEMAKKGVKDVTFAELTRLDVGAWKGDQFKGRRVSRMSEVFARMKGHSERHLYLDIKNVDLKQLAAEVKAAGVESQVVLASPKHEIIREWKSFVPRSDTLLWIGGTEVAKRKAIDTLKQANFEGITQVQVHVRLPSETKEAIKPGENFTPERAFLVEVSQELSKRGILFQTLPYGAKDEAIYHQLLDLGLASFATDHPEVTLKAVRDYYGKPRK